MKHIFCTTMVFWQAAALCVQAQEPALGKARTLIPALRAAEKALSKSAESADFESVSETMRSMELMNQNLWAMARIKTISTDSEGNCHIRADFDPQRGPCNFMTPEERDEVVRWDEKSADLERRHSAELASYRSVEYEQQGPWKVPKNRTSAPSHVRERQELEKRMLIQDRSQALRHIDAAVTARKSEWSKVELLLNIPAELAESMNREKMLKAEKVKLTFRLSDLEIRKGPEGTQIPPYLGSLAGNIVDIDPKMKKEVPSAEP